MDKARFFTHCPERGLLTPLVDAGNRTCDYRSWDVYEVEKVMTPHNKRLVIWHHKLVTATVYHQFKALEGLGGDVTQGTIPRVEFETEAQYVILKYKGTIKERNRLDFYRVCKEVGREAVVGEPLEFLFADPDQLMERLWAVVEERGLWSGNRNRALDFGGGLCFSEMMRHSKRGRR
ncbi:hypothetical protein CDD80_2459 [Ophiocordyceps camponoti-rufipedis]|uniref:Uncharacterized protein n=1 Tax=Ophiocordyceps camponoti-rufipedis TaxID=2004952 RepID=A0A2C5YB72_9HYPO|nr:hypothetical protein CDD80_2459 [Ophiocordyceps camponoti-rufipedis]